MSNVVDDTHNAYRTKLERFLADKHIAFNGNNPWDIKVYNPNLYKRMLTEGSIGFGEAYMDGWWDCDQLDGFRTVDLQSKILPASDKK